MKAEIAQITLLITLPKTAPSREPFLIWVNWNHATWGFEHETKAFFNKTDTEFITKTVEKVCQFAASLESFGSI